MKIFTYSLQIATLLALCSLGAHTAQAQLTSDGGATGGTGITGGTTGGITAAAGTGGSANTGQGTANVELSTEVDTSAFDLIDRGSTIGGTTEVGFGLASQSAGGARSTGGIGGGGLGAFGGLGGLNSLFGGGLGGSGQSSKPIIRTRIRSAIQIDPIPPARVQQTATTRLQKLPLQRKLAGVNVQMIGRTAVVSGTVGSESDRRMTELLLRLEPGVSKVDNRVVVSP